VLRAVTVFVGLMALFHAIEYTRLGKGDLRRAYVVRIAQASAAILNVFGEDATVTDNSIRSSRFSVQVVRGCDALLPTAAYVSAVIASPVAIGPKILGILVGTASLLAINLIRIVSLFFIGIYFPNAFHMIHFEVWQALFVVLAIVAWAIWVQWATRERPAASHARA
jgi:exosortase/archaeosortase family protein